MWCVYSVTSHIGFRSVAVITSASHAEGPRFEPGRKQREIVFLLFLLFYDLLDFIDSCQAIIMFLVLNNIMLHTLMDLKIRIFLIIYIPTYKII